MDFRQNTLHNRKRGAGGCDMVLIVFSLSFLNAIFQDPDGPLRDGKSLDGHDEIDDRQLISIVFSFARSGQFQKV